MIKPVICLIAAVAQNGVIGRDNGLPWRLSGDLQRFKALTMNKPLIMGRKTYETIGAPLPGRTNIVLSRKKSFSDHGIKTAEEFVDAIEIAEKIVRNANVTEIMVIGGARVYETALTYATRMYLTEVHEQVIGDTVFPSFDRSKWDEELRIFNSASPGESADYSFVTLNRQSTIINCPHSP